MELIRKTGPIEKEKTHAIGSDVPQKKRHQNKEKKRSKSPKRNRPKTESN
jgi:hypothetical protein